MTRACVGSAAAPSALSLWKAVAHDAGPAVRRAVFQIGDIDLSARIVRRHGAAAICR